MDNTNDGIVTGTSGSTIQNNAVAFNNCGISGDANVYYNTIENNNYGFWGQTNLSTITNNNILNNNIKSFHLTQNYTNVNATDNWWGTTNSADINATISDSKDFSYLGTVTFIPFLTQPASTPAIPSSIPIPTAPPSSTSTPTPTETPVPTQTSSPSPSATPTSTPYSTATPQSTPSQTPYQPLQSTTKPLIGNFASSDIDTVVVIVSAVVLAVVIIVIINRKFGQAEKPQIQPQQRRHKPKNTQKKTASDD